MRSSSTTLLWLLLAALPACANSHVDDVHSHLDGPIDFDTGGGFGALEVTMHLALDGAATAQTTAFAPLQDPPETLTGTIAAATMQMLSDDVAAIDLESFADSYHCKTSSPCGADGLLETGTFHADGASKTIQLDRNTLKQDLPPGLIKIFDDLDSIVGQLEMQQP